MLLGDEVSTWLRQHRDQADAVLEQFKLALCPQCRQSTVVRRVFKALDIPRNDLPEVQVVYTDLLKLCQKWIRDCMRTQHGDDGLVPGYWDEIPIELQLTVPVMWEGMARGIMRNAAKDAGFDRIVLRSEPLCAAARYIYEGWKAGRIKAEEVYTFLDIGRGTGDVYTTRVRNPEVADGPPRITICCESHGALVGSQLVNDIAWEHILKIYRREFERLDIQEYDAHQQFTNCFEICKRSFPNSNAGYRIRFFGSRPGGGGQILDTDITEEEMEIWFQDAARYVCELLDEHLAALERRSQVQPNACVLTGGGSKNKFTFERVEAHLALRGIPLLLHSKHFHPDDHPVSYGALQLYLESPDGSLPTRITFYIVRGGRWKGKRRPKSNRADHLVHGDNKLLPIFVQEPRNRCLHKTQELEFIVDVEDRYRARLKLPIYSSEYNDRSGSRPYDELGNLRDGLLEWPLVFQDLPDIESLGYRQQRTRVGYRHYAIKTLVRMVKAGDHLEVKLHVLAADQRWPSEYNLQNPPTVQVVFEKSQEIWAAHRSHELSEAGENHTVCPRKRPGEPVTTPRTKLAREESSATPALSNYNTRRGPTPSTLVSNSLHTPHKSWIELYE